MKYFKLYLILPYPLRRPPPAIRANSSKVGWGAGSGAAAGSLAGSQGRRSPPAIRANSSSVGCSYCGWPPGFRELPSPLGRTSTSRRVGACRVGRGLGGCRPLGPPCDLAGLEYGFSAGLVPHSRGAVGGACCPRCIRVWCMARQARVYWRASSSRAGQ